MGDLLELEAAVLDMLLAGTHPVLGVLRRQLAGARVRSREFSGAGFFVEFDVPSDLEAASTKENRIHFGDVVAKLPELKHGAGFVLFVRDGRLEMLEGYSYDEPWPERVSGFELAYTDASRQQTLRALS
jgi:hypothetical protein